MQLFADPLHAEFAEWALGFITTGGADLGEIIAIAASMKGTDDSAYYDAWMAAANTHADAAEAAVAAGHPALAHHHFARASVYSEVGYHPLYGKPVDPRLVEAFDLQMASFAQVMALADPPGEALSIPFDGHKLPGYFVRAAGAATDERRPLVILTNGYDATVVDMYFGTGRTAIERGYHCLMFDGPGQGTPLVHGGVVMIPDWERVVTAVVDAVVDRPDVDTERIVLHGWSLGGFLAPRAATGEHRLAAVVADPPAWDVSSGMVAMAKAFGFSQADVDALPELSDENEAAIMKVVTPNRGLNWKLVKRGFWVNGADDLRGYLAAIWPFTLEGRSDEIKCPMLATTGEGDPLGAGVDGFAAKLSSPVTVLKFTTAEGAGGHCEMLNRALVNQQTFDWLDDTLAKR